VDTAYDVFISFNWKDRTKIRSVDKYLCRGGLTTFMAERDLTDIGSKSIYPEAYEALTLSQVFLAAVGPNGIGGSQLREIERANQSKRLKYNLLLSGIKPQNIPSYLEDNPSFIFPASRYSKKSKGLKELVDEIKRQANLT